MLGNRTLLTLMLAVATVSPFARAESDRAVGAVFAMTNDANNNQVISFRREEDGSLSQRRAFSTGGRGSGGVTDPLGSQGALTLTEDRSLLLAVNAGSGEISVFEVTGSALSLLSRTPCGGSEPVAVAEHGRLVYVVNAGGSSNVTGFHLGSNGELRPIPNSTQFLTTANSGASSLAFSPDGRFLVVTEKLTNKIDVFPVQEDGTLGRIVTNSSDGPGLFGIVFAPNGTVIVPRPEPPVNRMPLSSLPIL